ncbi:RDD family membrane protein [Croceitalea dokdonensis DOKDO 023]|uniref:RDD family membrane protein n=1 Tax=Croceitalea dokdonensis DOKDO 023 TaxID=1300341 RepID=A0A0P7AYD7_9FLAO|nr:RDD family protein [Croceitalea dokdonensis]KPM30458.1 RDD family membrane protein [Croceitalea dokdonensis DOKDO 023]
MNDFQIETAQNISISQNTAHLGDRLLAYLIDSFVIFAYTILVILLLVSLELDFADAWAIYLIASLPAFLYYVGVETLTDGKTIGKSLMKLRVVKIDGSKPSFANYFVRWMLRIIDVVLTTGGGAVLTILIRGNGQRIGDIAAGTTVISEKQKITLADTLLRDIADDYQPTFSQVTVFSDREIQTIKQLYDDARKYGHHKVILSLDTKIKQLTDISTTMSPVDFVDTVIKDYNYYTQKL